MISMKKKLTIIFLLIALFQLFILSEVCTCAEAQRTDKNFLKNTKIHAEGVKVLQEYLRIDTTNPPGNEMRTAVFLKKILDEEGIENRILDLGNNRANFYARLKGDGSRRPIILLHHMDVVPADGRFWKAPPFSGKIINGEIYGRGAVDIKGKGIIDLMTVINLKRKKAPLKRDIIYLAVADEEMNSLGSRWMVKNGADLLKNSDFLIDEGTFPWIDKKGNLAAYFVSIGEKSPVWLTIAFRGEPGHGSVPIEDSSVNRAIRAAGKILDYKTEFVILPEIVEELKRRLDGSGCEKFPGFAGNIEKSLRNKEFLETISKDMEINSLIRNTISITCLKGSDKINTIPNEAEIGLDCRLLPGQDQKAFLDVLKKVIDDENARIRVEESSPATKSPADTDLLKAISLCASRRSPGVKMIPIIITSSTDSTFYRQLGIKAYGFEPYVLSDADGALAHGNDERISIKNFEFGIDLLTDVILELNKI